MKMSSVQLDDYYCDCDNKEGIGELNIKTREYICLRCNKVNGGYLEEELNSEYEDEQKY